MFKRIASDALGLTDIGIIVKPEDYDKVKSDDFILYEESETRPPNSARSGSPSPQVPKSPSPQVPKS